MEVVKGPDNAEETICQWIMTYEKELLRLCCVYLKDISLAEDAVQETFLKAYRSMHAFRGESSARTWLVRIAVNVCKDMCRTSWFRMLRSTAPLEAADAGTEETQLWQGEVASAVMRLPRNCREVVLLHYYEGFSQTEIARMLHVSNTTIHRRIGKAYRLLRKLLEGGEADDE